MVAGTSIRSPDIPATGADQKRNPEEFTGQVHYSGCKSSKI
jgi:hypothetical protein